MLKFIEHRCKVIDVRKQDANLSLTWLVGVLDILMKIWNSKLLWMMLNLKLNKMHEKTFCFIYIAVKAKQPHVLVFQFMLFQRRQSAWGIAFSINNIFNCISLILRKYFGSASGKSHFNLIARLSDNGYSYVSFYSGLILVWSLALFFFTGFHSFLSLHWLSHLQKCFSS